METLSRRKTVMDQRFRGVFGINRKMFVLDITDIMGVQSITESS